MIKPIFASIRSTKLLMDIHKKNKQPAYYLYEIISPKFRITGLIGAYNINPVTYQDLIHHEQTFPNKVAQYVNLLQQGSTFKSPIVLAIDDKNKQFHMNLKICKKRATLQAVFNRHEEQHQIWQVHQDDNYLLSSNCRKKKLYIADGHHRVHASYSFSLRNQTKNLLTTMFVSVQDIRCEAFYRVYQSQYNHKQLIDYLGKITQISLSSKPVFPDSANQVGMRVKNQWYHLKLPSKEEPKISTILLENKIILPAYKDKVITSYFPKKYIPTQTIQKLQDEIIFPQLLFTISPISFSTAIDYVQENGPLPIHSTCIIGKPIENIIQHKNHASVLEKEYTELG